MTGRWRRPAAPAQHDASTSPPRLYFHRSTKLPSGIKWRTLAARRAGAATGGRTATARRAAAPPLSTTGDKTAAIDTSSCRHRRRSKNSCSLLSAPSEDRDWAALPHDTLFNVFLRLGSCEIMWGAEGVCKAWRRVALDEPKLWRRIHINAVPEWSSIDIAVHDAVDRSAGQSEAFSGPWNDESLLYLAERSPNLKHIHLSHEEYATYEVLIEAIEKLPLLEDLENIKLIYSFFLHNFKFCLILKILLFISKLSLQCAMI